MERYSEYKDSGVQWLGEIPGHWGVTRNKSLLKLTDEKVGDRKDIILLSLTKQGVIIRDLSEGKGKFPKDFDTYLVVRPNNLVFCLFDIDETPRTVGLVRNHGMLTGAYTNFEVNESLVLPEYIYNYYLQVDDIKGLRPYYTGLRKVVKIGTFLQIRMPLPPLDEQHSIVSYLDDKCGKIDKMLEGKQKQIELLAEMKQRIIADAVTRGLNPNVKMKATNIPWLPKIPEHWGILRNKAFLKLTTEKVGSRKDFTLLSLTKQGVIIRDLSEGKGKFPKDFESYLVVRPNNLVFCLFDIDETPRTVGLVRNTGMLTGAYTNFEVNEEIVLPEYAYYYYLQIDDVKGLRPYYTGLRKVVKTNTFLQIRMPVPPMEEQIAIVSYVEKKCGCIETLTSKLQQEIESIKEYKQRLISDVVTGQIKVC